MMLSVKCRKPILTWMCPILRLTTKDQTSVMPVASESTEDLFGEDATLGDEESAQAHAVQGQAQTIEGDARDVAENVEDTPYQQ